MNRVALARAIYGRFNSYILDDVFSALDADTEAKVFVALFGPRGLLRDKSVILATNQIYRLAHSSFVTVMHEGRPVEQGEYNQLQAMDGHMAQLVREFAGGKKKKKAASKAESDGEDEVADALTEPAEEEKQVAHKKEQDEGKQGGVAWRTYVLYMRGMGLDQAAICGSSWHQPHNHSLTVLKG